MDEAQEDSESGRIFREEGARPSSLVAIQKRRLPDRYHDLYLAREVDLINAMVRAELGVEVPCGLAAKNGVPANQGAIDSAKITGKTEEMKISRIGSLAALVAGSTMIHAQQNQAQSRRNQAGLEKATAFSEAVQESLPAVATEARPRLGTEYKSIPTFSAFREKLIADGWQPLPNPGCQEVVHGDGYEDFCKKNATFISCRQCEMVPETYRSTSDGYSLMRYMKQGVPLSVSVYGDIQDLDAPGEYGLIVTGWDYSESLNLFLLD